MGRKDFATMGERVAWVLEDLKERGAVESQVTFGKKIGVSGQAVGQLILGKSKSFTPDRLFAIEDVFGYSARWIATGKGAKNAGGNPAARELFDKIMELPEAKQGMAADFIDYLSAQGGQPVESPAPAARVQREARKG